MSRRFALLMLLLTLGTLAVAITGLFVGAVSIPASRIWEILSGYGDEGPESFIILQSRLPQMLTALIAGSSLSVAGLMLQTVFRNPLAGPSILGITSGASLGVALVMLGGGGMVSAGALTLSGQGAVMAGALAGSYGVMALLLVFATLLRNDLMLLITGLMTGYLASALITLLNYRATAQGVYGYTVWGMGDFSSVSPDRLPWFAAFCAVGLAISAVWVKPLNAIQLGDRYAASLGIRVVRTRNLLLLSTGILTAAVTSYCGPISFLGIAVPHLARLVCRSSDQKILLPATLLTGAFVGALCSLACNLPSQGVLPLNGVTPIIGVPVILWVIFRRRR